MTFPQVVGALARVGIERYVADLQRAEKTYYLPSGESRTVKAHATRTVATGFSASGVDAAVRAIQAGRIDYKTFCEQIAESGCVGYHVSLAGRRAVYYGRTGECHVEHFPT